MKCLMVERHDIYMVADYFPYILQVLMKQLHFYYNNPNNLIFLLKKCINDTVGDKNNLEQNNYELVSENECLKKEKDKLIGKENGLMDQINIYLNYKKSKKMILKKMMKILYVKSVPIMIKILN